MKSFNTISVLSFITLSMGNKIDYLNGYIPKEAECYLPLDVLFLQDTTQSFEDDLPNVVKQIPQMLDIIKQVHPNSRFGVAEFKDKPYSPFGWPEADYCYRLAANLTSSSEEFFYSYYQLYASGGNDLPESQYQACINAIQDPHTSWRNIGTGPDDVGAKVIIMSTDAVPHYDGDYTSDQQPESWVPYPGYLTDDMKFDCDSTRYPGYEQFGAAFTNSKNTFLAILTPDSDSDVVDDWEWVNEGLLHQAPEFYQFISDDSSDFILGVLKALESITQTVCPSTSSTTLPPTSTSPTSAPTEMTTHGDSTTAPTSTTIPSTETTLGSSTMDTLLPEGSTMTTSTSTTIGTTPTTVGTTGTTVGTIVATTTTTVATTPTTVATTGTTDGTTTTTVGPCPTGACPGTCDPDAVVVRVSGHPEEVDIGIVYNNGTLSNVTRY